MSGSTLAIAMIVVAAVAGLLAMLALVLLAARRPYFKHPHPDPMAGTVRGGMHLGDPRSQGPPEGERADTGAQAAGEAQAAAQGPVARGPGQAAAPVAAEGGRPPPGQR
jgi:hypothetical protein